MSEKKARAKTPVSWELDEDDLDWWDIYMDEPAAA